MSDACPHACCHRRERRCRAVVRALQAVLVADLAVLAHVFTVADVTGAVDPVLRLLLPQGGESRNVTVCQAAENADLMSTRTWCSGASTMPSAQEVMRGQSARTRRTVTASASPATTRPTRLVAASRV